MKPTSPPPTVVDDNERSLKPPENVQIIMALIADDDMESEMLESLDRRYKEMARRVSKRRLVVWAYGEAALAIISFSFEKLIAAADRAKKSLGFDIKSIFKR